MHPAVIQEQTGLARNTVHKALTDLTLQGWVAAGKTIDPSAALASVTVPTALLADDRLRAQARLLYGMLQLTPAFNHPRGHFTYQQLCRLTGISHPTLRHGIRRLVQTGWLHITQENKVAPLHFTLLDPIASQGEAEVAGAKLRIKRGGFSGETLMREYLSLLVASDQFQDNAAPGFLINPLTHARLQLDRFYPPDVAFEFNGPQHDRPTERFDDEIVAQQKSRDLMKQGHCVRQGITLVIVQADDLSLEGMQNKIPDRLPLRKPAGHEHLIAFLESEAKRYRQEAKDPHWLK